MAEITAALVKQLRDKTGAGMMDAKKALVENNGDLEASADWLREKGILKAAKKADRIAAEGLIGVAIAGTKGVAVEVNAETDFGARNDLFQGLVKMIADVHRYPRRGTQGADQTQGLREIRGRRGDRKGGLRLCGGSRGLHQELKPSLCKGLGFAARL